MYLSQDCVRDCLKFIESDLPFGHFLHLSDFLESDNLNGYSEQDIKYTLMKLSETDFLHSTPTIIENNLIAFSTGMLTWNGHKFLDTIRDPEVWSKTKKVTNHLESVSISLLSEIGSKVITNMIDKNL